MTKKCFRCKEEKDVSCFGVLNSPHSKDRLQHACRSCKSAIQRDYRKNYTPEQKRKALDYNIALRKKQKLENPEKIKLQQKDYNLGKYGISLQNYNDLFVRQNGLCLGCYRHASEFKQALAVDHDHKTGKIRGLLCINCNRTLGYAKDNPTTLRRLADYLERGIL